MKFSLHEKILGVFAALVLAAILVSFFLPALGRMTPRAHEAQAIAAIKSVLLACREYAADNEDGAYPPDLTALLPDYLDESISLSVDDGRGLEIAMIYHSGFHSTSDPETVVIESMFLPTGNRIVGTVSGYVRRVAVD